MPRSGVVRMDRLTLTITYDPTLIGPEFMKAHLLELEGVETVHEIVDMGVEEL